MSSERDDVGPLEHLEARNAVAEDIIRELAMRHARFDGVVGGALGFIPIAGPVAALALQLQRQTAVLFPELITRLSAVYGADVDDLTRVRAMAMADAESITQFVVNEWLAHDVAELAVELGTGFIRDLVPDIAAEAGFSTLAGALIPVFGAGVSAAVDYTIAATVTWRVGAMVSLHLQHGGFVGSRGTTYGLIKTNVVSYSADHERPGTLKRIWTHIDPVRSAMVRRVKRLARGYLQANPDKKVVYRILTGTGDGQMGFPSDIVEEALGSL